MHRVARSKLSSCKMEWSSKGWKVVICSWWLTRRSAGPVRLSRWNVLCIRSKLRDHVRGCHDEVDRAEPECTCAIEAGNKSRSKSTCISTDNVMMEYMYMGLSA